MVRLPAITPSGKATGNTVRIRAQLGPGRAQKEPGSQRPQEIDLSGLSAVARQFGPQLAGQRLDREVSRGVVNIHHPVARLVEVLRERLHGPAGAAEPVEQDHGRALRIVDLGTSRAAADAAHQRQQRGPKTRAPGQPVRGLRDCSTLHQALGDSTA